MIFSIFFYLFFYNIILIFLRNPNNKQFVLFAYLILFCFFIFRFDIGNDYKNYYLESKHIAYLFQHNGWNSVLRYLRDGREISFPLLSCFFSFSKSPFVWVNIIYSSIYLWCAYKIFNKYKIHFGGWLFIFVSEFLFFSWDRVRQGTAIMVILYAIQFVKESKPIKFVLTILVASFFHNSSIIALLFYPLKFFKIPDFVLLILLLITGGAMWSGVFSETLGILSFLFEDVEGYEALSYADVTMETFDSKFYKLRLTEYLLLGGAVIMALPPKDFNLYKNISVIGLIIFVIASGSMTFTRIAWIFLMIFSLSIPISLKESKGRRKFILKSIWGIYILMFILDLFMVKNTLGCVPYDSIFSSNFETLHFRLR